MKGLFALLTSLSMLGLVACSSATSSIEDEEDVVESGSSIEASGSKSEAKDSSSSRKEISSSSDKGKSSSSDKVESSSSTKEGSSSSKGDESSSSKTDEEEENCVGEAGKAWDGTTAKTFACGSGTKLNPYIIQTAEQLAKLSFIVGAKDPAYNADTYFKLGADIVLHDEKLVDDKGALVADSTKLIKWTPIGNANVAFAAHFDGDGHTVSGMFINTTSTHNGLFGNVSGLVKNVTVTNSWVQGGKFSAGVAGYNEGSIENVVNGASVTGTDDCSGGVIGKTYEKNYRYNSKLTSVVNKGIIVGKDNVGGIAGCASYVTVDGAVNHAIISGKNLIGGIFGGVGSSSLNDIKRVENHGKVSGTHFVGGVTGHCGGNISFYGSGNPYHNCSNSSSYQCGILEYAANDGVISGNQFVGGIAGEFCVAQSSNLSNIGNIEGEKIVGGVIGYSGYSKTSSMYNTGKVYGTANIGGIIGYNQEGVTQAAYTVGKVDGDEEIGVMIGHNYNTTMADYYYLAQGELEAFGSNDGGGFATVKTSDDMKKESFVDLLGDDFILASGSNSGYPILKWEIEE